MSCAPNTKSVLHLLVLSWLLHDFPLPNLHCHSLLLLMCVSHFSVFPNFHALFAFNPWGRKGGSEDHSSHWVLNMIFSFKIFVEKRFSVSFVLVK